MSEKPSLKKKERRRSSSSSSSYSSSSGESIKEKKSKDNDKSKEQLRPTNALGSVNKMRLDIGYKIQQEELSDSEESDVNPSPPRTHSKSSDILKLTHVKEVKRDRSKSHERRSYRSPSNDKRRERSLSKDFRNDRSQSKDLKQNLDLKLSSKYNRSRSPDRKGRSKSKERRRERSRSRDRRKRVSKSRERKSTRSPSRDKKKERSRSREKKRDRSKSKERTDLSRTKDKQRERSRSKEKQDKKRERSRSKEKLDKKRERSRSREKRREKFRRESRSPSYKKDNTKLYGHSKRGRSRERSNKRSHSRSRSRSRPRKRSRSRSFERSKRTFDKKNKLSILEKLGIELKVPEGQGIGEAGANTSGFSIPSYYNPAGVNPLKYAQQMQKRRLIWGSKKQEGETSVEKKEEEKIVKVDNAGPESVWKGTTFSQDQDGKLTAKFKRLMGIKDSGEQEESTEKNSELIQKQEEMFSSMEKQYEVARVSTHTHRGLGLGFGVHLPR